MPAAGLTYREPAAGDLERVYALEARGTHEAAVMRGAARPEDAPTEEDLARGWRAQRPLAEFLAAQPGTSCWLCCDDEGEVVGYSRVVRFDGMEELTGLAVSRSHRNQGIARDLLERCWPDAPRPDLGRVMVAKGGLVDLTLCLGFGVMPAAGHWQLRARTEPYLERRAQEDSAAGENVHVLTRGRAVAEWDRLEGPAIAHGRRPLHEFFERDRVCLACMDGDRATALCWVGSGGEIGPGVAASSEALLPVVLGALDRVAKTHEPEELSVSVSTISWWLLRRLRGLGFRVGQSGWVLCSEPLPGLDRYLPTAPPQLL